MLSTRCSLRVSDKNHPVAATGGSGTPPTYPYEITGLEAWYDVPGHSYSEGQRVTNLPDTSGNARHLVNHFAPSVHDVFYQGNGGPNSMPCLYFSSGFGIMKSGGADFDGVDLNGAGHLFMVIRTSQDPPVKGGLGLFGTALNYDLYRDPGDSNVKLMMMSDTRKTAGNWADNLSNWHILEILSSGSAYTCWVNSTQRYTTATNAFDFPDQIWLGDSPLAGNPEFAPGYFSEFFMYDHGLSAGDQTAMRGYLNDKYFP